MERLHKILAHAGFGSRRQCEELIAQGRVTVDGVTVSDLGHKADPAQSDIRCDGVRVKPESLVYFLVNKPRGVVCTSDPREPRPRAVDLVRHVSQRLYTVGRLDADSRGLLILTNDGELTNQLTHPRHEVSKRYHVRVRGSLGPDATEQIERGVFLAEGKASASRLRVQRRRRDATDIEVELRQGVNRQIRRMLAKVGHPVIDLQRVAIGPIRDPELREGAYRTLRPEEIVLLRQAAETSKKAPPSFSPSPRGKTAAKNAGAKAKPAPRAAAGVVNPLRLREGNPARTGRS
jgi:23S rRNA pseudouridine2605 synthase